MIIIRIYMVGSNYQEQLSFKTHSHLDMVPRLLRIDPICELLLITGVERHRTKRY